MAYVPNFENDVFLSYSHLDDEVDGAHERGWVSDFKELLEQQLQKRLGSGSAKIWMDREFAHNEPLAPELVRRVRGSALLLVVMSPSYLKSAWCRRERQAFLDLARERFEQRRIFIVNSLDVGPDERPPDFGDLVAVDFWVNDRDANASRTLGEVDRGEPLFRTRLYQLSAELARELGSIAASVNRVAQTGAVALEGREVAFVARATDELEGREEELRHHLIQAGLAVPPRRIYAQATRGEFEAAVRRDLEGCRVFAQVLGASRGQELAFEEARRLPAVLQDLAVRAGVKKLSWRDRALDPASVADDAHRALVADAVACPFEEFKRMVVAEATRRVAPPAKPTAKLIVFVDRDRDDRSLAERAGAALTRDGAQVYFPIDDGTPEQIRGDLEGALRDADGVLVVFGKSEIASVRARLRQHTKVLNQRPTAPAAIAIAEGPPGTHESLEQLRSSLLDPDIMIIDGAEGLSAQHLAPFLARLRGPCAVAV